MKTMFLNGLIGWPAWPLITLVLALVTSPAVAQEPLSDEEANDLIEEIKRAASEAENALKDTASDRLYLGAATDAANYEPEQLLEWVSTKTRWTPYSGRLRGSNGVLMDRRGNSLDRAILLSRLLEDAGYETRLARAQLSAQAAENLWERNIARDETFETTDRGIDQDIQLSDSWSVAEVTSQVSRIADDLTAKISWSGPGEDKARQVTAARDHWWVQVMIDLDWKDYDPLYQDPAVAARPEPQSFTTAEKLAPELDHGLRLQVVIERFQDGRTEEEVALELNLLASDIVLGAPIELRFLPYSDAWDEEDKEDSTIANTAEVWLPITQYNGVTTTGEWISDDGLLVDSPFSFVGKEKLDAATKGLAGLGVSKKKDPPQSHLTAVWLDYQITRPERTPLSVRRELTDLLGPHRRAADTIKFELHTKDIRDRGLALMGYTAILPLTSSPAPAAVNRAILELWAENRNPFIAMVYQAAGWEDERVQPALDQFKHKPVDLLTIAALRQAWNQDADEIFVDQFNVLATHFFIKDGSSAIERTMGVDMVANGVGVIPTPEVDPRRARLKQGVLDTLVEGALFEPDSALNTFYLTLKEVKLTEWPTIELADRAVDIHSLSPASQALIADAVRGGNRAVVYPESLRYGNVSFASWWEVDPRDGNTLGRGYRGWGAVIAEKTIRDITIYPAVKKAAQKTGKTVGCKMAIVATTVAERVVVAELHAAGKAKLPVRKFQKACYILK